MFGSVPVGQTHRRLSFFVMVLCYSWMLYVEFTYRKNKRYFATATMPIADNAE
jgi:transposase